MMQGSKVSTEILKYANELDGNKKLSCSDAFKIKDDLNVEFSEIIKGCNKLGIKISKCQLGCF
jgi:LAO/AO transport system kinase